SVVDIFAPGNLITSAWYTSSTATSTISGTSMASPHVAGVAALYLEAKPGSTPAQVSQGLKDYATSGVVGNPGTGSPNLLLHLGDFTIPPPLAAPALLSPASGSPNISTSPTLSWSASSGATEYRVQVSTVSNFSTLVGTEITTSATSVTISGLSSSTTYFWRVAAVKGAEIVWSGSRSFTTVIPIPTLLQPNNAATSVSRTPTFTWNTTGAASYDIQVATRSNFTSSSIVATRTGLAGTSFTQTTALRSKTLHYWRVRSRAANGTTSAWSATRSFTTL
ncbi:MAG: hypothetical protein RLZZ256_443, partial [Bacteroidota bacterium]